MSLRVQDMETGLSRNCGIVTMKRKEDGATVLKQQVHKIDGQTVPRDEPAVTECCIYKNVYFCRFAGSSETVQRKGKQLGFIFI